MRYLLFFLITVFGNQFTNAQIYEAGVFAGGSNFIGDVGATNYISPNQLAFGGIIKWNRSPRHAYRASIIYTKIKADDLKSDDSRRQARGFGFKNGLLEISAGMEFNFFDFNQHDVTFKGTPYLYTGITLARHENFFFNSNGIVTSENNDSWAYGIPMVLGYKALISPHLILGAEIGARYTFSDELDGSVPSSDSSSQFSFGNVNSNDWYMFSGITLTYTFGQKPCYCNF